MNETIMLDLVIPTVKNNLGARKAVLVLDSARTHTTTAVLAKLKAAGILPCVIPGGMTQYLQAVDTDFCASYRRTRIKKFRSEFGDTPSLTAMEQRTATARLVLDAYQETLAEMDLGKTFTRLGYINRTNDSIAIRGMEGYTWKPVEGAQPEEKRELPVPTAHRLPGLLGNGFTMTKIPKKW